MNNRHSLQNPPRLHLILSENSSSTSQNSSNDVKHRTAIDQSVVIGSLYNAITDSIHGQLSIEMKTESKKLQERICVIKKGGALESENFLEIIGIDGEQRLSLMLNLVPTIEISKLIISSIPINKFLRFFYYCDSREMKYIFNDKSKVRANIPKTILDTTITHIVNAITFGIHVVIALEIPSDDQIDLDDLLNRITEHLIHNKFLITKNQNDFLDRIALIKVFSNIPDLAQMTKLTDICKEIIKMKQLNSNYRPIKLTLRPINWFYPTENNRYTSLEETNIHQIEQYLIDLSRLLKPLKMPIDPKVKTLLEKYRNQLFEKLQDEITKLEHFHLDQIKCIGHIIMETRSGKDQQKRIDDILKNEQTESWRCTVKSVTNCFDELINTGHFIKTLTEKYIHYDNMQQSTIQNDDDLNQILRKIFKTNKEYIIFCSNDELRGKNSSTWDDIYQNWIKTNKNNDKIHLVYADFSYCKFNLAKMPIVSSNQSTLSDSDMIPTSSEKDSPPIKKHCHHQSDHFINVLLLGESGVGKSTFINAFINYLAFQNLDQAHSDKPIALIPVSFLITTGDSFEERIVQFGNEDSNEDHHHPGQSVTQQCKSYVFNINNKIKLRLIDTPGMGDTRGLDQDDLNIQHILSYINNLEHLNAICILLKPNESRLNVVFRSYFNNLLKFLGPNVRDNIVFCFTNTRSTFFTPGNTAPLLKSMIKSHQIKKIPFEKLNTFCFDNESFRYLIALQSEVQFDDYQKQEYKLSWITSVSESTRMFKYICQTLKSCPQNQWSSIEHAYFQIKQLIRPILETIRNIYRNIILIKRKSSKSIIKFHPESCPQSACICYSCQRVPKLYGDIWIIPDDLHIFNDKCNKCEHSLEKHVKTDYTLQYEHSDNEYNQSVNDMESILDRIKKSMQQFAHFFADIFRNSDEIDPILSALNRIITEEDSICKQNESSKFNSMLHGKLIDLRKEYEAVRRNSLSYRKNVDLNDIYNLIKDFGQLELISEQINIIKQVHHKYIEQNEIHIPHRFNLDYLL